MSDSNDSVFKGRTKAFQSRMRAGLQQDGTMDLTTFIVPSHKQKRRMAAAEPAPAREGMVMPQPNNYEEFDL